MRLIMGCRTVLDSDMEDGTFSTEQTDMHLYDTMVAILGAASKEPAADGAQLDSMLTPEERAAGKLSRWRYLKILDQISSTAVLGLRIDAAVTVSDGKLGPLPLPAGFASLRTLRREQDVAAALLTFLQKDLALAKALLLKVQAVLAALERSAFFARHVFLRSALLLTYDDAAREDKLDLRLELKMINFAFSYEVTPSPHAPPARGSIVDTPQEGDDTTRLSTPPSPSKDPPPVKADAAADTAASAVGTAVDDEGGGGGADGEVSELSEITICHTGLWGGAARSHTDGYLLGVRSLESVMRSVCEELEADAEPEEHQPSRLSNFVYRDEDSDSD